MISPDDASRRVHDGPRRTTSGGRDATTRVERL
eukprot:CAMPEP_0182615006 /NCGR_PEP_ID=MMETSP1330-20130603/33011_1 /TAXON_ID=464278 /ORGANISM="Picochlorum sp., Strain RCC944" /LENGTH=32 /DNA_ID= /DNA_START= /DNA_END= /DNA_ORIENTATION=